MSIVIASVVLAAVWIGSEGAQVDNMSIAIVSVLLVAVVLFLVGLSLETLRRFSGQDRSLELPEADDKEGLEPAASHRASSPSR